MPQIPPEDMPRITPYIFYEDVGSALAWLSQAFGFRERPRMPGPEGSIMHAEMELQDGVIMLGNPGAEYQSPKRHGRWVPVMGRASVPVRQIVRVDETPDARLPLV